MKWHLPIAHPVTSILTALPLNRIKSLRRLLPLIPLLFLALDLFIFPVLIETSDPAEDVTGASLISIGGQPLVEYLGNYKAHRIYVSLDDIDDQDYLPFLTHGLPDTPAIAGAFHHSNTALALSISPQGEGWGSLALTRILGKLASLSSDDRDGIIDLVRGASPSENILWYDFKSVSSTSPSAVSLPLDHLVILRLPAGKTSAYSARIREMLETAGKKHLSALVLPCLATAIAENDSSLSCAAIYEALFRSLEPGSPSDIFLSLDKNWSTETIKHQVESIKEAWKSAIKREDKSAGAMPTLYQSDLRLLLLFLPICLTVCSFRVALTARNYVIITIAFVASGLEVQEKVAPLLYEVAESTPAWVIKCALLAILSGGFLFFAGLDIEGFFKGHDGNPP